MPAASVPIDKQKFESVHQNFAYELLFLEMKIEDFFSHDDHDHKLCQAIYEEISRLMDLYTFAMKLFESSSDSRFHFYKPKIQNLKKRKVILEQMLTAREMQMKKEEYQMQFQLHQEQVDKKKITQIVNNSEEQAAKAEGRIKNQLINQQRSLQQRIRSRKLRSQSGGKKNLKFGDSTTDISSRQKKDKLLKTKENDIKMEYFCNNGKKGDTEQSRLQTARKGTGASTQKQITPRGINKFFKKIIKQ